ncbi:MAG: glycosyltransferase, partial [Pseudodesulfovibrio sp.]
LAVDALAAAFAENPLDGAMAADVMGHDALRPLLPRPLRAAMGLLAAHWRRPGRSDYFALLPERDLPRLKACIKAAAAREPDNLFWRTQALTMGLVDNDPDWVETMMAFTPPAGLEPLLANVAAILALRRGRFHDAARLIQSTGETFGPAAAPLLAGLAMLRAGDAASANLLLRESLARAPWNTSLILRLHDLLAGWDQRLHPLPGSTAVLLYTWNKAVELDATLHSLYGSELSGASVFVLNNGSTDATGEVLASWTARFETRLGPDRFATVTLPVNIGAPAARNWLKHLDAVRKHDFACYLDDDVELPADWLLRLGAAVRQYPDAGVWGCKVVDHANPALIQHADSHLLADPDGPPPDLRRAAPNPFRLSDLHIQTMDNGLFDHLRPCASVTGCCHLFRTRVLAESGDFALHLSPTQYDDMEHDLRLCESGRFAVCQGHLAVRHRKRSGAAARVSAQAEGNALGNKYKMQTMHEREAILAAARRGQELLEADLQRKMRVVEEAEV